MSSAAVGGQTLSTISATSRSPAMVLARILAAPARRAVAADRPAGSQSTSWPAAASWPPMAAPMAPGCSTPMIDTPPRYAPPARTRAGARSARAAPSSSSGCPHLWRAPRVFTCQDSRPRLAAPAVPYGIISEGVACCCCLGAPGGLRVSYPRLFHLQRGIQALWGYIPR
jgi:hypothetical protein